MNDENTSATVEVIELTEDPKEYYYLKPRKPNYRSLRVPTELFERYTSARNVYLYYRQRMKEYFQPIKDKQMRVEKYHQDEEDTFN